MFSEIPVMVGYSNQLIADLDTNVIKIWSDHVKIGTIFLKMVRLEGHKFNFSVFLVLRHSMQFDWLTPFHFG